MEVNIRLKDWSVSQDKENAPNVTGTYEIIMVDKVIATQSFNSGGYSSDKKIPFSGDLIRKLKEFEKEIVTEINQMVS